MHVLNSYHQAIYHDAFIYVTVHQSKYHEAIMFAEVCYESLPSYHSDVQKSFTIFATENVELFSTQENIIYQYNQIS